MMTFLDLVWSVNYSKEICPTVAGMLVQKQKCAKSGLIRNQMDQENLVLDL